MNSSIFYSKIYDIIANILQSACYQKKKKSDSDSHSIIVWESDVLKSMFFP
jgi:hypothetical protein